MLLQKNKATTKRIGNADLTKGNINIMRKLILIINLLFFLSQSFGQTKDSGLQISHLTGDFYIYTTYVSLNGAPFPANGMYLVTNKGVVMFDTPWDSTQFQPLLDSIRIKYNKSVIMCI